MREVAREVVDVVTESYAVRKVLAGGGCLRQLQRSIIRSYEPQQRQTRELFHLLESLAPRVTGGG